jgi:hypothetical protein
MCDSSSCTQLSVTGEVREHLATVDAISPAIYALNPAILIPVGCPIKFQLQYRLKTAEAGHAKSVGLIAQALLAASSDLSSVLPVRLEDTTPIARSTNSVFTHYALSMQFRSGRLALLPLSLWLLGGEPRVWGRNQAQVKDRDPDRVPWKQEHFPPTVTKFHHSPVLKMADAQIVDRRIYSNDSVICIHTDTYHEGTWLERRVETNWQLCASLAATEGHVTTGSVECVSGQSLRLTDDSFRCNSVIALVRRLADSCPVVSFRDGRASFIPFSRLSLDDFDFPSVPTGISPALSRPQPRLNIADDAYHAFPTDHSPSCLFHKNCTSSPRDGSAFCSIHPDAVFLGLRHQVGQTEMDSADLADEIPISRTLSSGIYQFLPWSTP